MGVAAGALVLSGAGVSGITTGPLSCASLMRLERRGCTGAAGAGAASLMRLERRGCTGAGAGAATAFLTGFGLWGFTCLQNDVFLKAFKQTFEERMGSVGVGCVWRSAGADNGCKVLHYLGFVLLVQSVY